MPDLVVGNKHHLSGKNINTLQDIWSSDPNELYPLVFL